jgi:hypothetical protein
MQNQGGSSIKKQKLSERLTTMDQILEERCEGEQDESMISADRTDPLITKHQQKTYDLNEMDLQNDHQPTHQPLSPWNFLGDAQHQ